MGRIDRKKELAEGFKNLMQEMDFDKITIQEIAIRAGIERKNFYYHFKDKIELCEWILETEFVAKLTEEERNNTALFLDVFLNYLYDNRTYYRKLFIAYRGNFSFISSTSRAYLSRLLSPYRTISCPTYGHNAERSFLASFFSDALMLSISNWMINDDGTPPAVMSKRFRYISDLLFPGDTF